jgi:hypothetical protein
MYNRCNMSYHTPSPLRPNNRPHKQWICTPQHCGIFALSLGERSRAISKTYIGKENRSHTKMYEVGLPFLGLVSTLYMKFFKYDYKLLVTRKNFSCGDAPLVRWLCGLDPLKEFRYGSQGTVSDFACIVIFLLETCINL